MLLVLRGEPRSTQPWSHLKLLRNGHNHESPGRRCLLAAWICGTSGALSPHPPLWRPVRQVAHPLTKAQSHVDLTWMPIGASGTDAGHQDDVDGQDKEEEEIGRGNLACRTTRGDRTIRRVLDHEVEQMTRQKRGRRRCLAFASRCGNGFVVSSEREAKRA